MSAVHGPAQLNDVGPTLGFWPPIVPTNRFALQPVGGNRDRIAIRIVRSKNGSYNNCVTADRCDASEDTDRYTLRRTANRKRPPSAALTPTEVVSP